METKCFNEDQIIDAARLIQNGEIVAFPTDTVYGLGADATNEDAVKKIFTAKSRPNDRALTVLLANKMDLKKYTKNIPKEAFLLIEKYWPGPLTIILKSKNIFAKSVNLGLETVGIRMPNHPLALEFIEACGVPLAAPSANLTGRPSPTSAEHVLMDLNKKISAVIDGGETEYGIESTVVDLSDIKNPIILRPGGITQTQIESVIKRKIDKADNENFGASQSKHYEPSIPIYIVESNWEKAIEKMKSEKIALLASEEIIQKYGNQVETSYSLGKRNSVKSANASLFKGIRVLEKSDAGVILVETYPENEGYEAYLNRIEKAARGKKI